MVLPGMKYIFVPSFIILTLSFITLYYKMLFNKSLFYEFLKTFYPLIILGIFYLIGILISSKTYNTCLNDITEFYINISLLYFLFITIHGNKSVDHLKQIFKRITKIIAVSSVFASLVGISNYVLQFYNLEFIEGSNGSSLNMDSNFFALYSFLGIISFLPIITKQLNLLKRIYIQILILLLIINIFFTFSARSLFILGILFFILILVQLLILKRRSFYKIKYLSINSRFLTFTLFGLLICMIVVVNQNNLISESLKSGYIKNQTIGNEYNNAVLINDAFKIDKLKYATEIFKGYNTSQKIIGNGFSYLEEFGNKFKNNNNDFDYPHNPILSSLLYSGLLGSLFVLVFLIISIYYGLLYIKKYPLFSSMLFISSVFILFSGNSIFSVPIFLFLFSLSFLIRHQEISDLHIDFNLIKPGSKLLKELFDYLTSIILLIILFPLLIWVSIILLFSMGWPVFYSQNRIGQNGKLFRLYKFRTMKKAKSDTSIAAKEIARITKVGKFLRKTKIDELPELINIIRGDMSFVGPRPDVPGYADLLDESDKIILQLKPGLTGPASLKYVDEEEILKTVQNPQEYNDNVIFPDKVRINKAYMRYWNFWIDIKIIIFTALRKKLKEKYFQ